MSESSTNSVNSRLDQSVNGTPKLNPDEQRKYLGTFRERVSLGIKIGDLKSHQAFIGFQKELKSHPKYVLIINGNLSPNLTTPYLTYASQHNVQFNMKTDSFYRTSPNDYGLIYASHQNAINQYPINVMNKYPVKRIKKIILTGRYITLAINILMIIFTLLLLGIGAFLFRHRHKTFLIFKTVVRNFGITFIIVGIISLITLFTQNTIYICVALIIGCVAVTAFYLCMSKFIPK
ncbi:MAG: Hypothetical protein AJITA_01175 [Acetilactobacillus jinshanensis]